MNGVTSNTFFTINSIQKSTKRSNFTLDFFNAACHVNSGITGKRA